MLVDLARMVEPYIADVASKQRPQLARVFRCIEEHFRTPLKLGDLARAAGLSSAVPDNIAEKTTDAPRVNGSLRAGWPKLAGCSLIPARA